jgi:hypothetical protein
MSNSPTDFAATQEFLRTVHSSISSLLSSSPSSLFPLLGSLLSHSIKASQQNDFLSMNSLWKTFQASLASPAFLRNPTPAESATKSLYSQLISLSSDENLASQLSALLNQFYSFIFGELARLLGDFRALVNEISPHNAGVLVKSCKLARFYLLNMRPIVFSYPKSWKIEELTQFLQFFKQLQQAMVALQKKSQSTTTQEMNQLLSDALGSYIVQILSFPDEIVPNSLKFKIFDTIWCESTPAISKSAQLLVISVIFGEFTPENCSKEALHHIFCSANPVLPTFVAGIADNYADLLQSQANSTPFPCSSLISLFSTAFSTISTVEIMKKTQFWLFSYCFHPHFSVSTLFRAVVCGVSRSLGSKSWNSSIIGLFLAVLASKPQESQESHQDFSPLALNNQQSNAIDVILALFPLLDSVEQEKILILLDFRPFLSTEFAKTGLSLDISNPNVSNSQQSSSFGAILTFWQRMELNNLQNYAELSPPLLNFCAAMLNSLGKSASSPSPRLIPLISWLIPLFSALLSHKTSSELLRSAAFPNKFIDSAVQSYGNIIIPANFSKIMAILKESHADSSVISHFLVNLLTFPTNLLLFSNFSYSNMATFLEFYHNLLNTYDFPLISYHFATILRNFAALRFDSSDSTVAVILRNLKSLLNNVMERSKTLKIEKNDHSSGHYVGLRNCRGFYEFLRAQQSWNEQLSGLISPENQEIMAEFVEKLENPGSIDHSEIIKGNARIWSEILAFLGALRAENGPEGISQRGLGRLDEVNQLILRATAVVEGQIGDRLGDEDISRLNSNIVALQQLLQSKQYPRLI